HLRGTLPLRSDLVASLDYRGGATRVIKNAVPPVFRRHGDFMCAPLCALVDVHFAPVFADALTGAVRASSSSVSFRVAEQGNKLHADAFARRRCERLCRKAMNPSRTAEKTIRSTATAAMAGL